MYNLSSIPDSPQHDFLGQYGFHPGAQIYNNSSSSPS